MYALPRILKEGCGQIFGGNSTICCKCGGRLCEISSCVNTPRQIPRPCSKTQFLLLLLPVMLIPRAQEL